MDIATYQHLLRRARRLTRSAADAADLVHDTLIASLESGREDRVWLYGVLRKQAALAARSAVRRRSRESAWVTVQQETEDPLTITDRPTNNHNVIDRMPPGARRVALLALHGLSADEIRWVLDLSPTAFRQRLTSIRRSLGKLSPELRAEAIALAYLREPAREIELQFGLTRRALHAALGFRPGLGTHDLDGHLLVFQRRCSQIG